MQLVSVSVSLKLHAAAAPALPSSSWLSAWFGFTHAGEMFKVNALAFADEIMQVSALACAGEMFKVRGASFSSALLQDEEQEQEMVLPAA